MKVTDLSVDSLAGLIYFFSVLGYITCKGVVYLCKLVDKDRDARIDKHRAQQLREILDNYFKNKGADEDE